MMDAPRPTDKQVWYIMRLAGVCTRTDVYREIGRDLNMSHSKARRKATRHDASQTIERLLAEAP